MARKPKMYRKLSGSGFSLLLMRALWQGPDHLLWVEGSLFKEQYKRFYFTDIQALVMHRTHRRTLWTVVWGVFLVLFSAIAFVGGGTNYFSIVMAAIFLVVLVVHWLLGPGCEVFLQTAVQMERLSSLVRERKAIKVLNRIKAEAEQAQGGLSELTISNVRASISMANVDQKSVQAGAAAQQAATSDDIGGYDSRLHWALFGCLLVAGLVRGAQFQFATMLLVVADMLGLACTLVLSIIVLGRYHSNVKGTLLSLASWFSMIFAVIQGLFIYAVFIAASIQLTRMTYNNLDILRAFLKLMMEGQPIIRAFILGIAIASIALGLFGVVAIMNLEGGRRIHAPNRSEPSTEPASGESA